MGSTANASLANSVALGFGSSATAVSATTNYTGPGTVVAGKTLAVNLAPANGVVAIGKRQIQGLADGEVSATSTDAVSGSQLFSVAQAIQSGGVKYFHATSALADSTATGTDSVAIGPLAGSAGASSVALGNGASAVNADDAAFGSGSKSATAVATTTATVGASTFKGFAGTAPASTVSIGASGKERTLTNVAAGAISATSTDAINGSELFVVATQVDANTTNIANINKTGAKYFHTTSALGDATATGTDSVAIGPLAVSKAANGVSIGNGATTTNAADVALGSGSTSGAVTTGVYNLTGGTAAASAKIASVVSVGAPGAERQIQNVAAGVLTATSTDAVNGSQLFSVATAQINRLDANINAVKNAANTGTAIALAASGLRYADQPGKTAAAGAISTYKGRVGMALGLGHTSENGRWRYNLSASFSPQNIKRDIGVVAGASYTFD